MNKSTLALISVLLLAAFARLLPHPPNVVPITAMALFGGAMLERRMLALFVVLGAMLLSDLVLGIHALQWVVYLALAVVVLLGSFLKGAISVGRVVACSFAGSVVFFVITNFAVWAEGLLYPRTFEGLALCFTAAIPFFQNSLLGDLFFAGLLFGGWELTRRRFSACSVTISGCAEQ